MRVHREIKQIAFMTSLVLAVLLGALVTAAAWGLFGT